MLLGLAAYNLSKSLLPPNSIALHWGCGEEVGALVQSFVGKIVRVLKLLQHCDIYGIYMSRIIDSLTFEADVQVDFLNPFYFFLHILCQEL